MLKSGQYCFIVDKQSREVCAHQASLTRTLLIEVPIPSQYSE